MVAFENEATPCSPNIPNFNDNKGSKPEGSMIVHILQPITQMNVRT